MFNKIKYILNMIKNIFIIIILFEIFYKIKFRIFFFNIINIKNFVLINFIKSREIFRNDIFNIIKLI